MARVQCVKCGNIQEVWGRWWFQCKECKLKQSLENALISDERSEILENRKKESKAEKLDKELEKTPLEIEIKEEKEETEKPKEEEAKNPNDYDFICGNCKELFNDDGNRPIKCPACNEVFEE